MFEEILATASEKLGPAPRTVPLWDRLTYWRVPRPAWLYVHPDDALEKLFLNLDRLRRNGVVVWGALIQANNLLYSRGRHDCPGEVVYAWDQTSSLDELLSVARALGRLKHTTPADPSEAFVANYLTNERIRVFGVQVPATISPERRHFISTVYFVRKHLPPPDRCLQQPVFPLLVHPESPHVALVLPSRYWPAPLIDWWNGK